MSKHIIFEDWIPNYLTYDDAINNRDVDPYADSKFKPIKEMTSKRKGRFFEVLTEEYVEHLGWRVSKPENSDHDTIINGKKVEIKGSFRWVVDGELNIIDGNRYVRHRTMSSLYFLHLTPLSVSSIVVLNKR